MIQVIVKNGKIQTYVVKGGLSLPTISNVQIPSTGVVGNVLTVTYTLGGGPASTITRRWYRGATLIFTSTTSDNYTLQQSDAGNTSDITCNVTVTNSEGSNNATSNTLTQVFDFHANAAIVSGSITGSRQKSETNQFIINLKAEGETNTVLTPIAIWDDIPFIPAYCPVNDTTANATSYAVNFKDTSRNFTLVGFVAGDFSIYGLTGGTGKYVRTGYRPNVDFSLNSAGLDAYSRTNSTNNGCAGGCSDAGYTNGFYIYIRDASNKGYSRNNDSADLVPTVTNSSGIFSTGRTASNVKNYRRNGIVIATSSTASTARSSQEIYLHCLNLNGTAVEFDSRQFAGFVGRLGLSEDKMAYFLECWTIFQTNVVPGGRQV